MFIVDTAGRVSAASNIVFAEPSDGVAPGRPVSVFAEPDRTAGVVRVTWAKNSEGDVAHYWIYRGDIAGGSTSRLGIVDVIAGQESYEYFDPVASGGDHFYSVAAVDTSGNPGEQSLQVMARPRHVSPGVPTLGTVSFSTDDRGTNCTNNPTSCYVDILRYILGR